MNKLQHAMAAVVEDDVEELGEEAVRIALGEAPGLAPSDAIKAEADALILQRQRDLDAALADSIEVVSRHRARLSRKVCSRHDGETTRRVFELLRGMLETGADGDPSFQ